jgi:alternate signal-mediated exported protein
MREPHHPKGNTMNKITKASIAAGAAVLLLMGGGGTLAYWNASTTAGAGSITAGVLTVTSAGAATVEHANGDPLTLAVPGDTIVIEQDLTLNATGDNLKFEVAITPGTVTGSADLIAELLPTADDEVSGSNISEITAGSDEWQVDANGTTTVTVKVTITWPFGTAVDNGSQGGTANFAAATFTVTQIA